MHFIEICVILSKRSFNLDGFMYDDYDLDYTYTNDYTDLHENYAQDIDLDEDYARDAQNYESLAYRHYA